MLSVPYKIKRTIKVSSIVKKFSIMPRQIKNRSNFVKFNPTPSGSCSKNAGPRIIGNKLGLFFLFLAPVAANNPQGPILIPFT